jgi:hypothetical protein
MNDECRMMNKEGLSFIHHSSLCTHHLIEVRYGSESECKVPAGVGAKSATRR